MRINVVVAGAIDVTDAGAGRFKHSPVALPNFEAQLILFATCTESSLKLSAQRIFKHNLRTVRF